MRINTNVSALNAQRNLSNTTRALEQSIQRLSSGFRINRSGDDAAGLSIANKLRAEVRGLSQAGRNAAQAGAILQIADGAIQTISTILERMKELASQAASDNVTDQDRVKIEAEFTSLRSEIQRIVDTTKYQGKKLLDGSFGNTVNAASSTADDAGTGVYAIELSGTPAATYTFTDAAGTDVVTLSDGTTSESVSVTADGKQTLSFSRFGITVKLSTDYVASTANAAGSLDGKTIVVDAGSSGGSFLVSSSGQYTSNDLITLGTFDLTTGASGLALDDDSLASASSARTALTAIDSAIATLNAAIGTVGAAQNRIDMAAQNVASMLQNTMASESVIRDADLAAEMVEFTKAQILQQAGTAMLAQANAAPQTILQLLRG